MPYIETLRALIREKEAELARLEADLVGGRAYVRLLEERVTAAEQRQGEIPEADDPVVSVVTILAASGHPLFIDEILEAMGQTVSRDSREQLPRILLPWVRRGGSGRGALLPSSRSPPSC